MTRSTTNRSVMTMKHSTMIGALIAAATLLALAAGSAGFYLADRRGQPSDEHDQAAEPAGMADMRGMQDMQGADGMEGMQDMEGTEAAQDMQGMAGMGGMSMDGSIRLTSSDVSAFGITFGTAEVRSLVRDVRAVGAVEFDETRMVYVAPKFGGWIEKLHVDFTGQRVGRGDPLFDVYSPELVAAQEELLVAARMGEAADGRAIGDRTPPRDARRAEEGDGAPAGLLSSARRRLSYWDVPDERVERILETEVVPRTLTVHAPMAGIVMEKGVVEGEAYEAGANLYMIADLSEVWVNAEVFETDIGVVREGMDARIVIAAFPGEVYTGTVEYVYPTLGDRTRSMRARIALRNPATRLKPGMYATVSLRVRLGEMLAVPASAILYSGERAVVFVAMDGGEIVPREVVAGLRGEDGVQVLEGLEPGERVVTSAQFLLDSESNLAEVMRAMMAQMGMSDMGDMDMDMGGMEGSDTGDMDMGGMDMGGAARDSTGGR